jgi:hypothetical protein
MCRGLELGRTVHFLRDENGAIAIFRSPIMNRRIAYATGEWPCKWMTFRRASIPANTIATPIAEKTNCGGNPLRFGRFCCSVMAQIYSASPGNANRLLARMRRASGFRRALSARTAEEDDSCSAKDRLNGRMRLSRSLLPGPDAFARVDALEGKAELPCLS